MSKLTYQLGYVLGTATKDFLHGATQASSSFDDKHQGGALLQLPPPCIPDSQLREMDQFPAMLRVRGIDLNTWYAKNTREVEKRSRKRRSKTKAHSPTIPAEPAPIDDFL